MGLAVVDALSTYLPELNVALGAGIAIFARMAGFVRYAPVLSRSEIPNMVKLSIALLLTIIFTTFMHPPLPPHGVSLIFCIIVNYVCGALIGFVANCIVQVVAAGGDIINMQMGLSSAMVLDPTSQSQVSILGKLFALMGIIIFIDIGGVYWLIEAFLRSFEVFPMYGSAIPLEKLASIQHLSELTGNILFFGLQIASPVLLATLAQDIILGLISKTAPQVNVFQLSFLFKPVLGAAIIYFILPIFFNTIKEYFLSFATIF